MNNDDIQTAYQSTVKELSALKQQNAELRIVMAELVRLKLLKELIERGSTGMHQQADYALSKEPAWNAAKELLKAKP